MRQAILTNPGNIEFKEIPGPSTVDKNEVLLRIKKIGICGSDIHAYHGKHPATPYPVVQGHEYAGIIEAVGDDVKEFSPGMRVTARPQLVCGECASCKRGQYNICHHLKVEGFQAPGVAQDLFIVTQDRVVPFPDNLTFEEGAMIEPTSVAAHSTRLPSSLQGKNVVVSGAGTIGNLVAQFARARGAKKVLITDLSDFRLDIARKCGIEGVNVSKESFEEKVESFFEGEGFQVGFEAAGVQASLDILLKYIDKGSEVVVLGVFAESPKVNMFYLGEHELKLLGSLMYLHEDYTEAVEAISSGKIILKPLITDYFDFEDYREAYKFIDAQQDRSLKVIINM